MKTYAVSAPDWLTHNAVYQINPRTFCKEGTIKSVENELNELKSLGFNIMYLCPVFEADDSEDRDFWSDRQKKYGTENPKNPYRMNDYFNIDSEYGTNEDLRSFVRTAHSLGMRVLLDLVYFHIGPNAPILKTHPEFAYQNDDGSFITGGWHFPRLDFRNGGLREYLWCNMVYFISEYDVDGYRCDVGDSVPIDFWIEGRRRIRAVKPDAVLINEGVNSEYVMRAFDSCYNFEWHTVLYEIFAGRKTAKDLRDCWEKYAKMFPSNVMMLRDIDNHDTVTDFVPRTELVAGHDGMEQIEVINYIIDGIPMVYCGNELADRANVNMFANRFYMGVYETTDRKTVNEAADRRRNIIIFLNNLKKESDVLRYGKTSWIDTDRPDEIVAFIREYNGEKIIFVGNVSDGEVGISLDSDGIVAMSNKSEKDGKTVKLEGKGYTVIFGLHDGN